MQDLHHGGSLQCLNQTPLFVLRTCACGLFIGIKEEEIANRQDVVVNVAIHYPADKARDSEDINDALNYRTITKRIISHLENGRFSLLEKLTQDVLNIACEHHWVTYAEVEIDKLHALRYADSVSMTMSWRR
ncbi:Dihydroneopterin triphosphate epimerase [Klebsiella pneumoniae IS46]|uniref:Dihydroneopterin triphosphate 2'-epimerase n=1 Tax=Klebsiella pneumoniae IS43 TaxID=1432552 RepID=W1DHA2_KLEPN|nr:Dihydroneopterin triphosphate epimerase [Klebsiella pneumoniae IS43]CDL17719.1 Dihydroneopterin triphosphate epimerase [Klebsiella pneumoniae IS46]CDL24186.1 Dihydroneopterin triphosphate epimerase [Klebsiella pneumoniae IS53]